MWASLSLSLSLSLSMHARACMRIADMMVLLCRPGKRADFAVLSASPLDLLDGNPPPRVLQTYVDGTQVYSSS